MRARRRPNYPAPVTENSSGRQHTRLGHAHGRGDGGDGGDKVRQVAAQLVEARFDRGGAGVKGRHNRLQPYMRNRRTRLK